MIKAEMIAMLCFCLACFLDMADMLITAGLAANGLTARRHLNATPSSANPSASLLLLWVQIEVQPHVSMSFVTPLRPYRHVCKRLHSAGRFYSSGKCKIASNIELILQFFFP